MNLAILAALFSVAVASGESITGRVVDDATGAPISKSEVRIFRGTLPVITIEAGDDGTFQTGDLTPGDYTMTAWHAGYLFTEVTSGHPPVIRLVRLGVIEGQLTGLAGRPAKVLALVKSGDIWKPVLDIISRGVLADADGNFRIPDLPPGQYALLVAYGNSGVVRFPAGVPMPIPSNGDRVIEGHVELTAPQDSFRVTLSDPAHPELAVATAATGELGSFSFPGIVAGVYELLVTPRNWATPPYQGFARVPVDVSQGDARGLRIAMQPVKHVSIAWRDACKVAGIRLTPLEDWATSLEWTRHRTGVGRVGDPMLLESPQTLDGLAPARYGVSIGSDKCQVVGNPVLDLTKPQSGDLSLTLAAREIVPGIPDDFTNGEPALRTRWFSGPAPAMPALIRRLFGWDQASPSPPHVRMAASPSE